MWVSPCPCVFLPQFVRDGSVTFEYRVDAERGFDFFTFEIDEEAKIDRVSQQLSYVKVSFPVTTGTHIFRWKYTKDFSLSYGDDTVFLRLIEVTGTAFADSSCTPCSAGFFASRMGSSSCTPCPANTAAPNSGSAVCPACGRDEYSFLGSTRCYPSQPCQQSDVVTYYSSCFTNNTRSQYYYYQTPKICSEFLGGAYTKPSDRYNLSCAPCSPGWQRNTQTGMCESCPTNTYSLGTGDACTACPTGYAGRRDFFWTNFEELPNPAIASAMGCTGECGTNGWRLGSGYIDSGVGHGAYSDVFFSLNVTTVSDAYISYNFSFECNRLCYLSYTEHDITGNNATNPVLMQTRTTYSFFFTTGVVYAQNVPMKAGDHMITFHFSKFDGTSEALNDLVKIHGIQVRSVASQQGGAASCQACAAGQYVTADAPYCKLTPPGTFSNPLATSPTPCPANTYAEIPGSPSCSACGVGTTSPQGASWCDDSCTWRLNADISYDLKPLSRVGGDMYGPIVDPMSRRNYYINVCTREHTNFTCFDDDNRAISTQSCMADGWGFGLDVGRVTNFYPHPTNPDMGVTIVYTNATSDVSIPCRMLLPGTSTRVTVPRSTNITFNCDPLAGFGSPEFTQDGSNMCTYNFVWNSLFACPACDDSDWSYYYSECVGGRQYKTYQWKDNPRKCHGGLPLPAPEERSCSVETQIACPAGTYLLDDCTPCPSGTFSLGGGKIINYWPYGSPIDPAFESSNPSSSFLTPQGPFMEMKMPSSSTVDSTYVTATFNWVQRGDITFQMSALTGNGYSIMLTTDPGVSLPITTHSAPMALRFSDVSAGTHTFRFTLTKTRYASPDAVGWLRIYNVTTTGTSRAASQCTPALPGTYTTSATEIPSDCPANTFQAMGRKTSCDPVPDSRWSPVGSERHYALLPCSYQDYTPTPIGSCVDGRMQYELTPKQPLTCAGPLPPRLFIPCSCAPGMYRDSIGMCRTCRAGEGWDASLQRCVPASRGQAAVGVWSFVKGRSVLPPQSPPASVLTRQQKKNLLDADASWYTTCHGTCMRPWSLMVQEQTGPVLESGLQVGWSVSSLHLIVPMAQSSGTLQVAYRRSGGGNTQFQIIVDGLVQHTDLRAEATGLASIPLAGGGERLISLVQFSNEEIISNSGVRITDLTVTGATIGASVIQQCPAGTFSQDGATSCTPCAPGTFTSRRGSSSCDACPVDTYSAFYGSTACLPCGTVSSTNGLTGQPLCFPRCRYEKSDGTLYDWNDLGTSTARLTAEQRRLGYPDIDVNVCSRLENGCAADAGQVSAAFACGTDPQTNSAHKLNFGTRLSSVSSVPNGIELFFRGGDACLGPSSPNRTTRVTIACPGIASASQATPILKSYSDCFTDMIWFTSSACRACIQIDYKTVLGQCINRKQTVTYVLDSEDCHHNDWTQPPSRVQPCSQVGISIGVVVGIAIALVLLVVSLAVFCMRHRKLTTEYRLLKEAHDGGFMDNETQFGVDDEDDEGVTLDQIHRDDDDDGLRLPTAQTSSENPHEEL